jgi:hypothetical protein
MGYQTSDGSMHKDVISNIPQYVHKGHVEFGAQYGNYRFALFYEISLTQYANRKYEIIANSQVIKPFEMLKKNYNTFGVEFACRLWGTWRDEPKKLY